MASGESKPFPIISSGISGFVGLTGASAGGTFLFQVKPSGTRLKGITASGSSLLASVISIGSTTSSIGRFSSAIVSITVSIAVSVSITGKFGVVSFT